MDNGKREQNSPATSEQDVNTSTASHPDSIICAIHAFIQEERRHSFRFLAKYSHHYMDQKDLVSVSPANADYINTVRSRAGLLRTPGFDGHWYTFTELGDGHNMQRTVAIEISPDCPATIDNMTVFQFFPITASYCVTPASTWLRDTYDWDTTYEISKYPEKQYDEQRRWWDNNGMAFKLLDLPPEIRELIYLHTINPVVVPDIIRGTEGKLILGIGISYRSGSRPGHNRDPDIEGPNVAILRVSKQVQQEATLVAHRDTTKRFSSLGEYGIPGMDINSQKHLHISMLWDIVHGFIPHMTFLRHVQLEMSAAMYFQSIGISVSPGQPVRKSPKSCTYLSILYTFTALRTLDFRFISPKHCDARCPWAEAIGIPDNTAHSCQKVWIDWFFAFAFPILKFINDERKTMQGAKRVTYSLSGCVKNSTKAHWQCILNDTRIDHSPTIQLMDRQIRGTKTEDGPIPCHCSTSCAKTDGPQLFQCSEHEIRQIEGLQEELAKVYWDFED